MNMKKTATPIYLLRPCGLLLVLILLLVGCTATRPEAAIKVYDFGPAPLQTPTAASQPALATLVLYEPQVSPALEGNALLYRLAYADAQQLKPYALARWSMPPAQLIGQRLRQQLGAQRAVVAPGEATAQLNLRLVLEEFSHVFASATDSHGLLRLRATLTQRSGSGETLLAQRSFVVQQAASTPDAQGAVRALTAASDQAIEQLTAWLPPL
ncbi:ABC-type transport auxiliary lipoprotein family protein [Rhodoferax sp.]|uniref:ABC-type transport auxiliary lipoprotein family protein n=2 Tax=Rhodoferax sp. TaxID=50421 RepID=UPI0027325991|nr:ABC-type transport auxiliary lipoprotein family protein [Rhodoferax sp.]